MRKNDRSDEEWGKGHKCGCRPHPLATDSEAPARSPSANFTQPNTRRNAAGGSFSTVMLERSHHPLAKFPVYAKIPPGFPGEGDLLRRAVKGG